MADLMRPPAKPARVIAKAMAAVCQGEKGVAHQRAAPGLGENLGIPLGCELLEGLRGAVRDRGEPVR